MSTLFHVVRFIVFTCFFLFMYALESHALVPIRATAESVLSWRNPLTILLQADENYCREHYANEPACSSFFEEDGVPAPTIAMNPQIKGRWHWQGGNKLVFDPDRPLTPGASYMVDLRTLPLSGRGVYVINPESRDHKRLLRLSTIPLAASVSKLEVWTDPAPKGQHAISATIQFTWQVQAAEMEKRISIRSLTQDFVLGKTTYVWSQEGDEVTLSAPITNLAAEKSLVEVQIQGLPNWIRHDQANTMRKAVQGTQDGNVKKQYTVPGKAEIFHVRKMQLMSKHNAALNREYCLELETSLYTTAGDVEKALKIIALPRKNTSKSGSIKDEVTRPYDWSHAPVISAEDLNQGVTLQPEPLNAPDELTNHLSFRVNVKPETYLFVSLAKTLKSPEGIPLRGEWQGVYKAPSLYPELNFLQPGNVLPLAGTGQISLQASGLDKIQWELRKVREPFLALLAAHSSNFDWDADDEALLDVIRGEISLPTSESNIATFTTLDAKKMWSHGLLSVKLTGIKGKKSVVTASRLLLMTDIGLFVKKASDGSRDAFVCMLSTGRPLANSVVQVLGRNGLPLAEAKTDSDGHAKLPSLNGFENERMPIAVVALQAAGTPTQQDFAWLAINDSSRSIDYSSFPISGRSAAPEGLTAYVFSQRGVFLPGETLHFGCIVRRGDWKTLPQNLPLKAVLLNPLGNSVMSKDVSVGSDGLAEISWNSPESAITGRYRLNIVVGEGNTFVIGSDSVRMEEFQPDTLTMQVAIKSNDTTKADSDQGWIITRDAGKVIASINMRNLHGLPAQNRKIRAKLYIEPASFHFPGYTEYIFQDYAKYKGNAREENLPEIRTDDHGQATVILPINHYVAGTMQAKLLLEGFEQSEGRAVTQEKKLLLSPLRYILGYKPAGECTNLAYIPKGRQAKLNFIALDSTLSKTNPGALKITLSARRMVQTLVRDSNGLYRYDEAPIDIPLQQATETFSKNKELQIPLPTDTVGDFLATIKSQEDVILALIPFSVIGENIRDPENTANLAAGSLRVRLNKADYTTGEKIRLAMTSPYDGYGLITIERDGVVASHWFSTQAGESEQSIDLPRDFEGRGYVNVALIRAWDSPDIYMEPLSSAVIPFTAAMEKRDLKLTLKAPERVKPGEKVDITLSSQLVGKALVFAVDEGILSLTSFHTPSPLEYLLKDRALDVETTQAIDRLMPDYMLLSGRLPRFGGDTDLVSHRFFNPFKRRGELPLATWSSLVDVTPQGTHLSFTVPDYYNGQVRIMAVASSEESSGNTEVSMSVLGSIILNPQMPLAVAPGDRFEAVVGIANNLGKDSTFSLNVETKGGLLLKESLPKVKIAHGNESFVPFQLVATEDLGEAMVLIKAENADKSTTVTRKISLSVRPSTPYMRTVLSGITHTPKTQISSDRDRYAYQRQDVIEASRVPLPVLRGLIRKLDAYPYGCTEQLLSRAFPYLLLSSRPDLLVDPERDSSTIAREGDALISAAIQALQTSFQPYGSEIGVSLWAGSKPNDTLTIYAGDFLLAMRKAGRGIPSDLENGLFDTIERLVDQKSVNSLADARIKAYAIWVLTREGRITTQAIEQLIRNLKNLFGSQDTLWIRDITGTFLAGSWSLMRMDGPASSFISHTMTPGEEFPLGDILNETAASALHTAILAQQFPEYVQGEAVQKLVQSVLQQLNSSNASTFATAQSIRALLVLSQRTPEISDIKIACLDQPTSKISSDVAGLFRLEQYCPSFSLTSTEPVYWQLTSSGYDRTPTVFSGGRGMEISMTYTNAKNQSLFPMQKGTSLSVGETIQVDVTAQTQGKALSNAVISLLVPGGLELELPRDGKEIASGQGLIRAERREDRLLLFVDLETTPRTWKYHLRAVNRGTFTLPPAQIESMYNPDLTAYTSGGSIEVL